MTENLKESNPNFWAFLMDQVDRMSDEDLLKIVALIDEITAARTAGAPTE
jgi:hypothetical protein